MQIGALPCCRRKMKKNAEKFVGLKNYAYLCRRIETKTNASMIRLTANAWWWRNSRFKKS